MTLSNFQCNARAYRAFWIAFIFGTGLFVASCTSAPPSIPPAPVPQKKSAESELQTIDRLIKEGRFDLAMVRADDLKDPVQKAKWTHAVTNSWNLADLKKADGMLRTGSPDQSLPLIDKILERDPLFFGKAPVDLARPVWSYYLKSKIRADQEFWVLKHLRSIVFLDNKGKKSIAVEAYAHLAQRRMEEKKYHAALIDIRRALKILPIDTNALTIRAKLALLEKTWTNNGDMAFTEQHLHRALFYWGRVIDLNPRNKEVRENIQKARSLLKKLEVLEKENKTK